MLQNSLQQKQYWTMNHELCLISVFNKLFFLEKRRYIQSCNSCVILLGKKHTGTSDIA